VRQLSHEELLERQQRIREAEECLPLTIILNDVRSLYNVGSIFRTADGAGAEEIILCGITGFPPHSQISKTALGAEDAVPWQQTKEILPVVRSLKRRGYQVVLLEQTQTSIPYAELEPSGPVCLIVGNEVAGVSDELLKLCDTSVEIEMAGVKNSLNVSVACGIVVYHVRNCLKKSVGTH